MSEKHSPKIKISKQKQFAVSSYKDKVYAIRYRRKVFYIDKDLVY
jgi:hypothetical protein